MKEKTKRLLISGISAAIGGALGAVSGSNSWIVVAIVAGVFGIIAAWVVSGMIR